MQTPSSFFQHRFLRPLALLVGTGLILGAPGMGTSAPTLRTGFTALLAAGLVMAVQLQVTRFLQPPRWTRWMLLPALAGSIPFALISLPPPVSVLLPLFALAWVGTGFSPILLPAWARFLLLSALAHHFLFIQAVLPSFHFPSFPSSTPVWIGIAVVLPLGIATQPRLWRFAKAVALTELTLVFVAASLIPLVMQICTGWKEVGEPQRDFYRIDPLPGFRSVPKVGTEPFLPSELRKIPDPLLALDILNEMNLALQPDLLSAISGDLDPNQVRLLLLQTGLLQRDRYGFFVPPATFAITQPPPGVDPATMQIIERLKEQASFQANPQTRPTLLRMRNLNLVDTLPGDSSRFRLTPQARHPFENELFPRQILFAAQTALQADPTRVFHRDYAPPWKLDFDQIRLELGQLVDIGVLEIDPSPAWQSDVFHQVDLRISRLGILLLCTGAGLLLLRITFNPEASSFVPVTYFAIGMLSNHLASFVGGSDLPLAYHAAWASAWLPVSIVFIGLALRPHPSRSPASS